MRARYRVPGTAALVESPTSLYAWPGILACWNALALYPRMWPPRLTRERSFAPPLGMPLSDKRRANRPVDWFGLKAFVSAIIWRPTRGPVGQLIEAQKELSSASSLSRFWPRPSGHACQTRQGVSALLLEAIRNRLVDIGSLTGPLLTGSSWLQSIAFPA